jgi:uncharacterized LabA/DUF88 family protein
MARASDLKRAFAFIDAGNTQAGAERAFGNSFGHFNPVALAQDVAAAQGWALAGVAYYYGGVPDARVTADAHDSWVKRCERWRKQGARIFTRTLLPDDDGVAREKGIDVRIALDAVGLFRQDAFDVALLFSQDQDFSELAAELRAIARAGKRSVDVVSAFPASEKVPAGHGISGMTPVALDEGLFSKTLDTPENRRRILVPLLARAPKRGPPSQIISARASAGAFKAAPKAEPKRTLMRGMALLLLAGYIAAAAATFVYLSWRSPSTALPAHARSAVTWPAYWLAQAHRPGGGEETRAVAGL